MIRPLSFFLALSLSLSAFGASLDEAQTQCLSQVRAPAANAFSRAPGPPAHGRLPSAPSRPQGRAADLTEALPQNRASRPDLCGYTLDVSARSSLWNLEAMDYAEGCP